MIKYQSYILSGFIVVIMILLLIYPHKLIELTLNKSEYLNSNIDENEYRVINYFTDSNMAANKLAKLNYFNESLISSSSGAFVDSVNN